jgi:hypothetical protein
VRCSAALRHQFLRILHMRPCTEHAAGETGGKAALGGGGGCIHC